VLAFLDAEGVGGDDMERVLLGGADKGQGDAGAAAGVLDDGAAGFEASVALGGLDHGQGHAVFHAAGRVLALDLEQDAGPVGRAHRAQFDHRCRADPLEHRRVDAGLWLHAGTPGGRDQVLRSR